jgi:hypothetical protein
MRKTKRRKCLHCHTYFLPDPRNASRQKYCFQPECRKASKAVSQRKWLAKDDNQNYFRGPDNVQRVQEWRRKNPGYWKKKREPEDALQDSSKDKTTDKQAVQEQFTDNALQELITAQDAVLLGLLAQITGSALQDDIVTTGRLLRQLGQDILTNPFYRGGQYDSKEASDCNAPDPPGSRPVQLGGSPSGP